MGAREKFMHEVGRREEEEERRGIINTPDRQIIKRSSLIQQITLTGFSLRNQF